MRLRSRAFAGATLAAVALSMGGCAVTQAFAPSDERLLEAASLTEGDAAATATFAAYEQGDVVAGQNSLDLCDATFPSERLRIGRQQVGVTDDGGQAHVSSEAILYSTPAEAQQAMAELAAAREQCPTGAAPSPDQFDTPLTWQFGPPPDRDWPEHEGVVRQAYSFTLSGPGRDEPLPATAVYLQRGRMILALYCTPPEGPAEVIVNSPNPQRFTDVMTRRLVALPERALRQGDPDKRVEDPRDIGT